MLFNESVTIERQEWKVNVMTNESVTFEQQSGENLCVSTSLWLLNTNVESRSCYGA